MAPFSYIYPKRARLSGWKATVFMACDRAQSLSALEALPPVAEAAAWSTEISAFLRWCEKHKFMVTNGTSWLHVAGRTDAATFH